MNLVFWNAFLTELFIICWSFRRSPPLATTSYTVIRSIVGVREQELGFSVFVLTPWEKSHLSFGGYCELSWRVRVLALCQGDSMAADNHVSWLTKNHAPELLRDSQELSLDPRNMQPWAILTSHRFCQLPYLYLPQYLSLCLYLHLCLHTYFPWTKISIPSLFDWVRQ